MKNKRLGEMLVDAKVLSNEQVEEAVRIQQKSGKD